MQNKKWLIGGGLFIIAVMSWIFIASKTTRDAVTLDGVTERASDMQEKEGYISDYDDKQTSLEINEELEQEILSPEIIVAEEVPSPVTPTTPATPVTTATPVTPSEPAPVPDEQPKVSGITLAEVSTHASESSCWTIVNGSVYDITSYIPRHPGGKREIMAICGKNG
jgi:cytochrome b involved in lipid metabolism